MLLLLSPRTRPVAAAAGVFHPKPVVILAGAKSMKLFAVKLEGAVPFVSVTQPVVPVLHVPVTIKVGAAIGSVDVTVAAVVMPSSR